VASPKRQRVGARPDFIKAVAFGVLLAGLNGVFGEALEKVSLLAPIRAGGNDGINNLVLIPQMDTAVSLGKNHWRVELSTEYIKNGMEETKGTSRTEITTATFENRLRLTYGLLEYLDLTADLFFTAYDDEIGAVIETESFFEGAPSALGPAEVDADRELADPILEAKFQVWGGKREGTGLALRTAVKFPLGDEKDLHSTGSYDFSLGAVGSLDLSWGVWHANVDYTFAGNPDFIRDELDVDLKNSLSFGVGYLFELLENRLAVGAQVMGYSNPYRDVPQDLEGFEGTPVGLLFDLRWFPYRQFSVELAAGPGLTADAADYSAFLGVIYQR
jgi:hypothetical protein